MRTLETTPGFAIEVMLTSLIAKIPTREAGPAVVMVRDMEAAPGGTVTFSTRGVKAESLNRSFPARAATACRERIHLDRVTLAG